jgi:hypothetical protein
MTSMEGLLSPTPDTSELMGAIHGSYMDTAGEFAKPMVKSLRFQYWKKCDRPGCRAHKDKYSGKITEAGWVTVGPTMESDPVRHAEYINRKHMTPLPQYGSAGTGEKSPLLAKGARYDQILEKGGLNEFPAEQIIAYNWDKIEIIRRLRPDVAHVERFPCPYSCVDRDFSSPEALLTHNRAVHSDTVGPEATGREMKKALLEMADLMGVRKETVATPSGDIDYEKIAVIAAQAAAAAVMAYEEKRPKEAAYAAEPERRGPGRPRKVLESEV